MAQDSENPESRLTEAAAVRLNNPMQQAETIAPDQAREGDGEAFRLLVEEHGRKMFALAYRMTGNEHDAEDVVQETFLRAYRNLGRYESRAQLGSWLQRIAANYAIDLLRRRKRWRTRDLDPSESAEPLRDDRPGPERAAIGGDLQRCIREGLAELTPRERIAFTLRHHEGWSIAEIGRVLGTRTNATKNHVFRAVKKLRRKLAPLVERDS